MTKRKICVMGRVLDQEDGLGVYASNLLAQLLVLDSTSDYVILLRTGHHLNSFLAFPNARTEVLTAPMKSWWDQVTVARAAARHQANLIFNPKFSLPLLSRREGTFVLHGSDWYINPDSYQWWDRAYIRILLPFYCRKAKHLLAISHRVVDDLAEHAGIDPKKVTVSYAAPSPHFKPLENQQDLEAFRGLHRLPEKYIFAVCRVYHTGYQSLPVYTGGNVEGLVDGYLIYRERGGRLPLVIAGRDIDQYLWNVGYDNQVLTDIHFTGFIPHNEIVKAYNLATFFVLTTLNESFAFPLVEALASGCPAIVPSTGACPEIAGAAALLVDPLDSAAIGQTMLDLSNSPELQERYRTAGLKRAQEFTWRRTAERTLTVFDQIVPRQPPEEGA